MLPLFLLLVVSDGYASEVSAVQPLILTVSSLSRDTVSSVVPVDREVQIHVSEEFDRIALYDSNPQGQNREPIYVVGAEHDFIETNVSLGNPDFPQGWALNSQSDVAGVHVPGEHCLPVWVAGFRNKEIVYTDCLKIHPTWMQDSKLFIGNLDVRSLFIPGTHNSGCYKRGEKLSLRDTIGRYILTQDQSVWNQLVYGIRYLDFRIGYYPTKENSSITDDHESRFWINHDLIKVRPFAPVLGQIKKFLERTTNEVVIMDLHRFPIGFNMREERHAAFVSFLERELKDLAIPFTSSQLTLDKIWTTPGRLIISYGENSIAQTKDWLWPPIKQLWGNKATMEELEDFMSKIVSNDSLQNPDKGLWAAMAQLTPGPLELLFNPKGSLREMAHKVNPNLMRWCQRSHWWRKLRIVPTDFFLETDIVNLAINANVLKSHQDTRYDTD
uniref:PI-PLC X domain-containing protein 1 n=2 Tax=Lygus hesperus TaxID=30085 RepID=A0A0K8SHX9_LYGHE